MPSFNQDWLFGGPYVPGARDPDHDDGGFERVTLPHTVTELGWADWDPRAWQHVWIYRKHFEALPRSGRRLFLDFDGVMTSAALSLGGVEISRHAGGYLPWSVELTPHVRPGHNVLALTVDGRWSDVPPDGHPGGAAAIDFLEPAGIHRDVRLRTEPEVFIADVFARPKGVLTSSPGLELQLTIDAARVPRGLVIVSAQALGREAKTEVAIQRPGTTVATLALSDLAEAKRWSPDSPTLFDVTVRLTGSDIARPHARTVRTGLREATFTRDGGFYLNGERLQLFGLNRHELFPYLGMAAPARLQRRDAELLKRELNCNMVRCSHYPQSPHFLDACDELGLLVWQEVPGWQYVGGEAFRRLVLENVRDMVVRDRNRPSIVAWGTRLNESPNQPELYAQARQLADALDGSRATTGAVNFRSKVGWAEDVFAYNDYRRAGGLARPVGGVPYLVSEAVGALTGAPLYRWLDGDATLAMQALMHAQVQDIAASDPSYAGLLGWAAIDYASLFGKGRTWRHLKWPGVLDTFRVPKPGAAIYRSQVDPARKPVILPLFHWPSAPAPSPAAVIATNCQRVEIFAADTHVASAKPDRDRFPHLAHPPAFADLSKADPGSELRIDGYVEDERVAQLHMSPDPTRDRLELTVGALEIEADGSDMTGVVFRAVDAYGNHRAGAKGEVTLKLSGPAALVGQNPFDLGDTGGVGGAFIRSIAGQTGVVTVTASHPALGSAARALTVYAETPGSPS